MKYIETELFLRCSFYGEQSISEQNCLVISSRFVMINHGIDSQNYYRWIHRHNERQ